MRPVLTSSAGSAFVRSYDVFGGPASVCLDGTNNGYPDHPVDLRPPSHSWSAVASTSSRIGVVVGVTCDPAILPHLERVWAAYSAPISVRNQAPSKSTCAANS